MEESHQWYAMPRGGTPLNDATGMMLDLAERGAPWVPSTTRFPLFFTDVRRMLRRIPWQRRCSKDQFRLKALRERGWQVTYLGPTSTTRSRQLPWSTLSGRCRHLLRFCRTMRAMAVSVVSTLRVRVICHGPHMNKHGEVSDQNIGGILPIQVIKLRAHN